MARATYGVNRDGWWKLANILEGERVGGDYVHGPVDFNPDRATLRGRNVTGRVHVSTGVLLDPYCSAFREAAHTGRLQYVIYSYATPIAWLESGGRWTVPNARYSGTTSKHQGRVAPAVSRVEQRTALARSERPGQLASAA